MTDAAALLDRLAKGERLEREAYAALIEALSEEGADGLEERLFSLAREKRESVYGRGVYLRGLIEITSFCKNDCYYCGIRHSNRHAGRYRLSEADILDCCEAGWALGLHTFVLQGGEDPALRPDSVARLVEIIKARYPACAVTLSLGEWPREVYEAWFRAGADRYLLRHETANLAHYRRLHPPALSPQRRKACLRQLKEIGYQAGAGFLVGSPWQTPDLLAEDLCFLAGLCPHMVGIGPFIPHSETPFAHFPAGSVRQTLHLIALVRLILPQALIPATTALATLASDGYERGMLAGANVVMPNLTPQKEREQYQLYENKRTGDTAAGKLAQLERQMRAIGYHLDLSRGDSKLDTMIEGG